MSDSHDRRVLIDLADAVRSTPGAPADAAETLEAHAEADAADASSGGSILDTAKEALKGLIGGGPPADAGTDAARLSALLARFDAALHDDRLSGPARDAVLRAFDPVKSARDAALQRQDG